MSFGFKNTTVRTVGGVRTDTVTQHEHRVADWLLALPRSQAVTSTTADGVVAATRRSEFSFDDRGLLEWVSIEPTGSADDHATVIYEHDAEGLLRAVHQTAAGIPARRTHLEYDGTPGHVAPSLVWDDLGHGRWFAVHAGYGVVMAEMDANGVQTSRTHDDLGRLVTEQSDGSGKQAFSYTQRGNGVTVGWSDETGASGSVELDALGRASRTWEVAHDGTPVSSETVVDVLGRVVKQSSPNRRALDARWTEQVYDSLGRVLRTVAPDGATTRYEHTFSETRAWDPNDTPSKLTRDRDDRIVRSVSTLDGEELATAVDYGPFDQVERITDPRSHVTTIGYDMRGRRTLLIDPDRGTTRYFYNGLGDLRQKEAAGDITFYERDALGRVYRMVDVDGVTRYSWDSAAHGMGRIGHTTSPDGTRTEQTYNQYGWPEEATWKVGGEDFKLRTEYDGQGRVEKIIYPEVPGVAERFTVRQKYNPSGYLQQIEEATAGSPGGQLWFVDARNDDGALAQGTYGNGVQTARKYEEKSGRLKTLEQTDGGALSSLAYEYYPDGRVKHRTERMRGEALGERRETYTYAIRLRRR